MAQSTIVSKIIFLFILFFLQTGFPSELICRSGVEMGTEFKICVYANSKDRLNAGYDLQSAFGTLAKINSWMSDWLPDTELNQINTSAGAKPIIVSQALFDLLSLSQKISTKTNGAYDPTFNVFFGLYNFKAGEEREPLAEEIKQRLPLIDYRKIKLNSKNRSVFLEKPGMKLGLGAIGQGYGVDQVVQELKQRGYHAGFVDGSGDTYFWGTKPDKSLWTAGIRNPFNKDKVIGKFYVTDISVTTSGDDEKFFIKEDRRIHHIIDPKTGLPASKVRQVTVLGKNATESDAWDTACFVLGAKECLRKIRSEKLEAVIVDAEGKLHLSKGIVEKTSKEWGTYWTLSNQRPTTH